MLAYSPNTKLSRESRSVDGDV